MNQHFVSPCALLRTNCEYHSMTVAVADETIASPTTVFDANTFFVWKTNERIHDESEDDRWDGSDSDIILFVPSSKLLSIHRCVFPTTRTTMLTTIIAVLISTMATATTDGDESDIDTGGQNLLQKNHHLYHGYLMLVSWTLLIPCGVICYKLLQHRDDPTRNRYIGFRIHEGLNLLGVVLAIVGYALAIMAHNMHQHDTHSPHNEIVIQQDEDENGVYDNNTTSTLTATIHMKTSPAATVEVKILSKTYHKILGHVVMIGAILNVLLFGLGFMKSPTKPSFTLPRNQWPIYQRIGHVLHKLLGYILFLGGYVVCFLGWYNNNTMDMSKSKTTMNEKGGDHNLFYFMITNILISVVFAVVCWYDKVRYTNQTLSLLSTKDGVVAINETTQLILTPTQAEI